MLWYGVKEEIMFLKLSFFGEWCSLFDEDSTRRASLR